MIAYGAKAFHDAIHPSSTLELERDLRGRAGPARQQREAELLRGLPTVVRFIALAGANDPSFQQAKPYLDAFTAIIGGGSGDRKAEIAIGLK